MTGSGMRDLTQAGPNILLGATAEDGNTSWETRGTVLSKRREVLPEDEAWKKTELGDSEKETGLLGSQLSSWTQPF